MRVFPVLLAVLLFCCGYVYPFEGISEPQKRQKVLIDCDLGGDIDDAFALALMLSSPEFEIVGLVMEHGQTTKRARIACKMLYMTGREEIPVVVGRETPLVVGKDTGKSIYNDQFYWAEGFKALKPVDESAPDFIIKTLRKFPNEVILFTLAPLSNIADVIRKDPGALKLAKHIYSMLGSYYMGYDGGPRPDAEWNVYADIQSAKLYIENAPNTGGLNLTLAGLDITTTVRLPKEYMPRLLMRQSPLTNALTGLYSLWGDGNPTLFDAVAVGMLIWPELFTTKKASVSVTDKGYTVLNAGNAPNCSIGISINKEEFIKRLIERLLRQNLGPKGKRM
ncbi:MAG: nucleoside hydrolase [Ignavibacteria bacterium]|jgi:inosine-uridine nucleoside N-ribohydrolase|nr:nucleoside hydrolase [Ignavibacteria bacterium]MCU7501945.1 nucleoside hydrolase [Ignavibacteria bacterium]MCU7516913.1 nucleoside hydrolase [Ignavibacteria bacterium]